MSFLAYYEGIRISGVEIPECFIATAAYGSELDPHVEFLREFRDKVVLKSAFKDWFGQLLSFYCRFSPVIARKMGKNRLLKSLVKYIVVVPFVKCMMQIAETVKFCSITD